MWQDYLASGQAQSAGVGWIAFILLIMPILMIWSVIWKGIALWRAGRNNQLGWFIAIMIINTLGILEIVYLLTAGKKKDVAVTK
ncbi:MAG: DUF5652 family protein [Candidatus Magasanikbacteria bacterium]